ncbi:MULTISPECIES: ABC transporter ATP-binding protein [unclassified Cellulomonas]|uniref:ABC transporter ATP-binding protein n=1 Tax=unclassified Cellulomonas TaxID=2620175 RepID=UPI001982AE8D|nr:ABC transporter ATP-binding protein [Cellulomonas sp. ES6]MBD3778654.1 ABC transporter ATP-binding protein [Micrococcales bacterium]WHP18512.1 ABC transporter ATP-binding protein [Cellulomonas sp. ES6]
MTDLAPPGTTAVSTRGLRKTYRHRGRRVVAVGGLDLDVPLGGVHGFLGPNGAGKTTTIRMLLGLVRPDAGSVHVLDRPVPAALPDVVRRVGAIVESPRFFPAFSGRRNLELLAAAIGTPPARVDRVLADVGLADRAGSPFRTYSLGMKQRLAIAATLLKDPELVIFDEPTNGLDPAGIREVRQTMRSLADAGRTVLVSSHILAEVQQVADTVSIVTQGRLVASGRVEDLVAGAGTQEARVGVEEPERAAAVLSARGWSVRPDGAGALVVGGAAPAEITRALAEQGLFLHELVPARADLEQVFLALTGTAAAPGAPGQGAGPAPYQGRPAPHGRRARS